MVQAGAYPVESSHAAAKNPSPSGWSRAYLLERLAGRIECGHLVVLLPRAESASGQIPILPSKNLPSRRAKILMGQAISHRQIQARKGRRGPFQNAQEVLLERQNSIALMCLEATWRIYAFGAGIGPKSLAILYIK